MLSQYILLYRRNVASGSAAVITDLYCRRTRAALVLCRLRCRNDVTNILKCDDVKSCRNVSMFQCNLQPESWSKKGGIHLLSSWSLKVITWW